MPIVYTYQYKVVGVNNQLIISRFNA